MAKKEAQQPASETTRGGGAIYRFGGEPRDTKNSWRTANAWKMETIEVVAVKLTKYLTSVLPLSRWPPGLVPLVVGYAAVDEWIQIPDMPSGRANGRAAMLNGHIYLAGGYIHKLFESADLDCYDCESGVWRRLPMLHLTHQMATLFNQLCFISGPISYKCNMWNPVDNGWTVTPDMLYMDHSSGCSVVSCNRLYMFGGTMSSNSECYDPVTRCWTPIAPIPTIPRIPIALVLPNNSHIIAVLEKHNARDKVHLYDTTTDTWSIATWQLPQNVGGIGNEASVHVSGTRLFVVGIGHAATSVYVMDFSCDPLTWERGVDLPIAAVCSHPAFI